MTKFYRGLKLIYCLLFLPVAVQAQIYTHDFGNSPISGKPYTVSPSVFDSHLLNSSWTTSFTGFTNFNGSSGQALCIGGNNTPSNDTYTLTFDIAPGYMCDITGINFWRQRSNTGPQNVSVTINGNSIGSSFTIPTTGSSIGLQTISNCNNLTGTVTVILTLSGATVSGGTFRLDDFTLMGSTYVTGVYSVQDGDWSTGSTWNTNSVPANTDNVTINHAITMNNAVTRDAGTQTNINAGHSLAVRNTYTNNGNTNVYGTFQLDGGGYADGSNFIQYFPGSYLVFNNGGNYDINTGQKFWPSTVNAPDHVEVNTGSSATLNDAAKTINNLILWGAFTNNNSITINGNLVINTNGYVANTPPLYGNASTLIYQSGNPYNIGQEWRASSQPHSVLVTNNSTLNYTALPESRTITGDLTIDGGSSLYMDNGSITCNGPLQVNGNVSVSGNLSLGYSYGDDLKIMGDLTFNSGYNFYPNKRAVFFIKASGIQKIFTPGNGDIAFDYLVIGPSSGSGTTVQINQNLTINAPNGGNVISFTNPTDILDMNGKNLSLGTNGIANTISGTGTFKGNSTSTLAIAGDGDIGIISFTTGSQILENIVINRSPGSTSATLGSALTLIGNGTNFMNGILNISSNDLTFETNSSFSGGNSNSFIQADGAGKVIKNFNTLGTFTFPIGDNTSGADYSPATITVNSLTGTPSVSMNVIDGKHANNTSPSNFITRYWSVTSTGTLNAEGTFNYIDADVAGTESSLLTAGWNGANWNLYGNVNAATNTLAVSGQSDLNRAFTAGDQFTSVASLPGDYFRSSLTGNWNVAGNWQSSFDGSTNWITSTLVPDQNAKGITIRNGHTITLTADTSARMLKIEAGGILDNTNINGGYLLTLVDDGTTTSDFDIYGTYVLYGKQPVFSGVASTATVYTGGVVRADDNYNPGNSDEFASNPKVNWQTGALFDWNTTNAFTTSGTTYFPNAGVSDITVFRISKNVSAGAGSDTYFNGLLQVNANVTFDVSGKKYFRNGICGNGTINQSSTCGNFIINGTNAILGGNNLKLNLTKVLNLDISVTVPVDSSVTISGANVDNSLSGNILNVNGILDMTSQNITNTNGTVIVSGTGTYRTSHSGGFTGTGSSIPSGITSLNPGSTVEFYGAGDQPVISRGDYSNIILSASGTKTPSSAFAPNGTITIKDNAIFDCTGKNIGGINTNLTMSDNSILIVSTTGTQPAMLGAYNITGGVIRFMHTGSGETIRSPKTYNNIEVWGSNVGNSSGNISLIPGGSFTIKNGGVFSINDNSISGNNSNIVKIESGGKFICGNNQGFNGFTSTLTDNSSVHANITNIILDPNSTVEYSRTGDQLITTANGLQYQNLTLSGTGNKIAPPGTLFIKGDFSKTTAAVFLHNSGTVEFNGTSVQNYSSISPYPVFYNLNNNNSISLDVNAPLSVKNLLSLKDNSKVNIDGDITLISDNNRTASIDKIPEGTNAATITYGTGSFIVERYIPNHPRAWQLLSVPTKGSTIYESWQNSKLPDPLRGTNITDSRTNWSANGFDRQSFSPSMKYYVPASDSYVGVDKTSDPIDLHSGYFLFVRGDRSAIDIGYPSTEVTLHTKGKIYAPTPSGEAPVTINVPPNSFALIGNPYASSINYDDISISPNIQEPYYIWDPQLTASPSVYGLGAFRAITANTASPDGGNYVDGSIPPIQSGQAFFVYNPSATMGTVSFSENAKITGSNSIFKTKKEIKAPSGLIAADLVLNTGGTTTVLDGTLQLFNKSYADETDKYDAKKMMNGSENIFLPSATYPLAIERKTPPKETDTTFLHLTGLGKRSYAVQFKVSGLEGLGLRAILHDLYTSGQQPLQEGSNDYFFEGNSDKASVAPGRFFITFKNIPPPFAFKNENAVTKSESVDLNWETISSDQVNLFTIEFGKDSTNFFTIKNIEAGIQPQYSWTHYPPTEGTHYYRITASMKDGNIVHSKVLKSEIEFPPASVTIFPNPAKDYVNFKLSRQPEGKYQVRLMQTDGKQVFSKYIYHTISAEHRLSLQGYAGGIYYLELIGPNNFKYREKIIIQ